MNPRGAQTQQCRFRRSIARGRGLLSAEWAKIECGEIAIGTVQRHGADGCCPRHLNRRRVFDHVSLKKDRGKGKFADVARGDFRRQVGYCLQPSRLRRVCVAAIGEMQGARIQVGAQAVRVVHAGLYPTHCVMHDERLLQYPRSGRKHRFQFAEELAVALVVHR